jgi:hypothetical protein
LDESDRLGPTSGRHQCRSGRRLSGDHFGHRSWKRP